MPAPLSTTFLAVAFLFSIIGPDIASGIAAGLAVANEAGLALAAMTSRPDE